MLRDIMKAVDLSLENQLFRDKVVIFEALWKYVKLMTLKTNMCLLHTVNEPDAIEQEEFA
ncbi:hypothetical protein RhiirC2_798511 [Rhizophagus irregularis]|uniref:Uncharacterized protein n=1 Tax=Rhizophagus irregularis TaxID=588596 RepID=A0A2N1M6D0_9GLOM|nr:hypothetical protein RhiirC2_798511 [Rhizophagus irregularis]